MSSKLKYLITGHPRCGSGFASSLFNKLGVNCSHEQNPINKDALSSWAFLIQHEDDDGIYPRYGINGSDWRDEYSFTHKITHLRNPFDAVPSIIDENNYDWSFKIRYEYIYKKLNKKIKGSNIEKAILSYIYWNEISISESELYFKIESEKDFLKLKDFLKSKNEKLKKVDFNSLNKINSKPNSKNPISISDYNSVSKEIKTELESFCVRCGYDYII